MSLSKISQSMGLSGLYLFSISAWGYSPGVDAGLVLMLIATLIRPTLYPVLWRHWLTRFLVFMALFLIASAIIASLTLPGNVSPQLTALHRWLKLLLFFLPAWWFAQSDHALRNAFIMSLLGLLLMISFNMNWDDFMHFRMVERFGFGLADPNETAMACAVYLLAFPLFYFRYFKAASRTWAVLKFCAFAAVFSLLLYVFILTLSRQAWLALAVAAPLTVLIQYRAFFKQNGLFKNLGGALSLLVFVSILAAILFSHRDFILSRVVAEKIELSSPAAPSSIGIRLNMLNFGLEKWMEKPVLGWGIGSSGYVIRQSQDKRLWIGDEAKGNHGYFLHLHNAYAEMLLRFGLLGTLAWLVIFVGVLHVLLDAYRKDQVPRDIFLFLSGMAMMMLIIGAFGFYVGNNRGCAYWLFLAGAVYSYKLKSLQQASSKDRSDRLIDRQCAASGSIPNDFARS